MKEKDLERELGQRSTAEIVNGEVRQVIQAISELDGKAKYLMFGELREETVIPIAEVCAKCGHKYFDTVEECQERQAGDARARGFTEIICPKQFR